MSQPDTTRKRKARIYARLLSYAEEGIIRDDLVVQGSMPGIRWIFSPVGYSGRAMTTNEVEWYIMGVESFRNKQGGIK